MLKLGTTALAPGDPGAASDMGTKLLFLRGLKRICLFSSADLTGNQRNFIRSSRPILLGKSALKKISFKEAYDRWVLQQ